MEKKILLLLSEYKKILGQSSATNIFYILSKKVTKIYTLQSTIKMNENNYQIKINIS